MPDARTAEGRGRDPVAYNPGGMPTADRTVDQEPATPRVPAAALLRIDPARAIRTLCLCIAVLLLLHGATMAMRLAHVSGLVSFVRLFDLDTEANVPTYYSVLQLACAAVLLMVIGADARQRGARFARHWLLLGVLFWFLSLDELAQIHESLSRVVRARLHVDGMLHFAWVIPYGVFTAAAGLAYLPFLMHLPERTRRLVVWAALIFLGGAAGMELYGGFLHARLGVAELGASTAYMTEVLVEEGMEMFGIALFIYALLTHMQETMGSIHITIGPVPTGPDGGGGGN